MPKQLMNVTLSANGSPSEVKDKFTSQVQQTADSATDAAVLGAVRSFVESALTGLSEDDSLSLKASIVITLNDVPKVTLARESALVDKYEGELRQKEALILEAARNLEAAKKQIEELTPKPAPEAQG